MRTLTALVLSFASAGRATTVLSTYDSSHVHQLSPKPVTINLAGGIGTGEVKATATTKTDGSESLHAIFDKKEGEIPRYRMPPPLGDNKWKPWAGNNIAAPAERGSEAGEYAYGRGSQYLYVEETNGKKKYTVQLVAIVDQDGRVWQNDALDRGVRDVAIMPQSDVLKRCLSVGTHQTIYLRGSLLNRIC